MKQILTFLSLVFMGGAAYAQCHADLGTYATAFDQIDARSFGFLDDALTDVKILGYGEDTHGTAEFTLLAKELMAYTNAKHGFKVFIIETGFGEGQYLNDYAQGKTDDLDSILTKHNSTWRYQTDEFRELMNWLRAHNEQNDDKIQVYGCEMQYVVSDVARIRAYLTKVGSDYKIDGFEKHLWQSMDESEKSDYYIAYAKLKSYFIENYETLVSASSEREFAMAYQHVMVIGQFVAAVIQNTDQRKHDLRDIYMAENIQWIMYYEGDDSKGLYWAHNAHVGDWVDNGGYVDVAGHQLRKWYGYSYFNLATDFGTGQFLAFPADANQTGNWKFETFGYESVLENSFSACLQKLGDPNVFVNFREARANGDLGPFLDVEMETMSGAGAQARTSQTEVKQLGKAFDGIIYLDSTNQINWGQ